MPLIERNQEDYCWEAGPNHGRILLSESGLSDCNGMNTPMVVGKEGEGWLPAGDGSCGRAQVWASHSSAELPLAGSARQPLRHVR